MSDENKILKVSYGKFSCTLEGFDSPFEAMKVITEYFGDLEAKDHQSGIEPPRSDADRLHHGAQAVTERRVETRFLDSGIVMRPEGATAEATPAEDTPAFMSGGQEDADFTIETAPAEAASEAEPEVALDEEAVERPIEGAVQEVEDIAEDAVAASEVVAPEAAAISDDVAEAVDVIADEAVGEVAEDNAMARAHEAVAADDIATSIERISDEDEIRNIYTFEDEGDDIADWEIDSIFADEPDTGTAFDGASVAARLARIRRASLSENTDRAASLQPDHSSAPGDSQETVSPAPVSETEDDTAVAAVAAGVDTGAATLAAADTRRETTAPRATMAAADPDEDMDRLFAASDGRFSTGETSRRRANIERLKAAVASREADEQLEDEGATTANNADDTAEYRDDLARVMRPRRVRVEVTRRGSGEETRPAPLVLASEQRVDAEPGHVGADTATPSPRRGAFTDDEAVTTPRPIPAAPLILDTPIADDAPEVDVDALEQGRPAPRKMAASLANLAQRASQISGGPNRPAPVETAGPASAEPATEVLPEPAAIAPPPTNATEAVQEADPIAALEAQLAQELDTRTGIAPAAAEAEAEAEAEEEVDHVARFTEQLSVTDDADIEQVVKMGAEYLTSEAGLPEFNLNHLVRMVRNADRSLMRNEVVAAVEKLTDDRVMEDLGDYQYRLRHYP